MKKLLFILFPIGFYLFTACSNDNELRTKILEQIKNSDAKIGVAVINTGTYDTLTVNNAYCYPMQSVYKFPLALAVLDRVDKGILSLDSMIHVSKSDLLPDTWSPLREKYKGADTSIALSELIDYTVARSDNNGCDILFGLLGGPDKVNEYIDSTGIPGINILNTESEMHRDWSLQYKNCSAPYPVARLLVSFYKDDLLSEKSKDFLWKVMTSNVFVSDRIQGKLPEGTVVGHKTGSSGVGEDGLTPATNDAGIVIMPGGTAVAIVVFVSDSRQDKSVRDEIIADISKAVYDYYAE